MAMLNNQRVYVKYCKVCQYVYFQVANWRQSWTDQKILKEDMESPQAPRSTNDVKDLVSTWDVELCQLKTEITHTFKHLFKSLLNLLSMWWHSKFSFWALLYKVEEFSGFGRRLVNGAKKRNISTVPWPNRPPTDCCIATFTWRISLWNMAFIFPYIYVYIYIYMGMSSSQLTNSYFSEGYVLSPPTSDIFIDLLKNGLQKIF